MRDLTAQEMSRLAEVHITKADFEVHADLHPEESFEDSVSYLVDLRQRLGLQPQKQEELPTTDGKPAQSTPVTELDPSDPNYVKTDANGWPVKEAAPVSEAPVAAEAPVEPAPVEPAPVEPALEPES